MYLFHRRVSNAKTAIYHVREISSESSSSPRIHESHLTETELRTEEEETTPTVDPSSLRSAPNPILTHRRSMSNPIPRAHPSDDDVPPTPELAMSPVTPRTPSLGHGFPRTPMYASAMPLPEYPGEEKGADSAGRYTDRSSYYNRERDVDPRTLFVGGLDTYGPNSWDEDKLRTLFERYGGVEDVKIIRPSAYFAGSVLLICA